MRLVLAFTLPLVVFGQGPIDGLLGFPLCRVNPAQSSVQTVSEETMRVIFPQYCYTKIYQTSRYTVYLLKDGKTLAWLRDGQHVKMFDGFSAELPEGLRVTMNQGTVTLSIRGNSPRPADGICFTFFKDTEVPCIESWGNAPPPPF